MGNSSSLWMKLSLCLFSILIRRIILDDSLLSSKGTFVIANILYCRLGNLLRFRIYPASVFFNSIDVSLNLNLFQLEKVYQNKFQDQFYFQYTSPVTLSISKKMNCPRLRKSEHITNCNISIFQKPFFVNLILLFGV